MSSAAHSLGFSRAHCPYLPLHTSWLQVPHHLQTAILRWSQKPPSRALPTSATQAAAPLIGLTQLPVLLTGQGLARGGGPWYLSIWTRNHLYCGHNTAPKSRSGLCPTRLTPTPSTSPSLLPLPSLFPRPPGSQVQTCPTLTLSACHWLLQGSLPSLPHTPSPDLFSSSGVHAEASKCHVIENSIHSR